MTVTIYGKTYIHYTMIFSLTLKKDVQSQMRSDILVMNNQVSNGTAIF